MRDSSMRTVLRFVWLEARRYPKLLGEVAGLYVLSYIASDVCTPLGTAGLLARGFSVNNPSLWLLLGGSVGIALLAPHGMWRRRVLESTCREELASRLDAGFRLPSNHQFKEEGGAIADKVLSGSSLIISVVAYYGLTPLAAFISMVVVLSIAGAWLVGLGMGVGLVLVMGIYYTYTFKRHLPTLDPSYEVVQEKCLQEQAIFDSLLASRGMAWLGERLTRAREPLTKEVTEAVESLQRQVTQRLGLFYGIISAWKFLVVVLLALSLRNWHPGNVILLVLYYLLTISGLLIQHDIGVLTVHDAISRAVPVVRFLQTATIKPSLPASADSYTITVRDAAAHYRPEGAPTVNVPLPDCTFGPGVYALYGPNGTGKTTLLGILSGQVEYSGSVTINDCEVRDYNTGDVISNTDQLVKPTPLSAREMLDSASPLYEVALRIANLPNDRWALKESELSGGQRQSLRTAAAISAGCRIILLDEPTNNMDDEAVDHLIASCQRIATMPGYTLVIATHDIRLLDTLTPKVIEFSR